MPSTTDQNSRTQTFLRRALIFIGVIVFFTSIFLVVVIYRTFRSGIQKESSTVFDSNTTNGNLSCLYGHGQCHFGATCTEENECQCLFNCTNESENWNACRSAQAQCKSYYEKKVLTCSTLNCSHGAQCIITDDGLPRCHCPTKCQDDVHTRSSREPICASDQQTYDTICNLKQRACEIQEDLYFVHLGPCQHCQDVNCSSTPRLLCASNLHTYSNECEMNKFACRTNITLTKRHDNTCTLSEQQQLNEVCHRLTCSNGKICMMENDSGVCRCLFNCSSEDNQICASNGFVYRNLCEMEHDRCRRDENLFPMDISHCRATCETTHCPYGQCRERSDGQVECECMQCSRTFSEQESLCGDNGVTYPSQCFLEHDACTKQIDIKVEHMGQCDNCQNVACPFNGQCRSEQGNYTCICPARSSCSTVQTEHSDAICASNQELFYSQCEMDIRSCELKTHLYIVATHHCANDRNETEYTSQCGYDEVLTDLTSNRHVQCDTFERCPINSYCNKQTNRCCVKVLTAVLPYRMCLTDTHCGRNMICSKGLCQCAGDDLMPARKKRECISLLSHLSNNSSCSTTPYGCCKDNVTISPTFDRQGCPEYCKCHPTGSFRALCDPKTLACHCRPAVGGLSCSHCESEYWAFSRIQTHNSTGCTPCGCHPYGSVRKDCSQDTGQCACQSFAVGQQCDRCIDPSLILTEHGCVHVSKNRRLRQRTCQELTCFFDGLCRMNNDTPRCTCDYVTCTKEDQDVLSICASDGRTYQSKCEMKQQQCFKQYEIVLMYLGACNAIEENFQLEEEKIADDQLIVGTIDSKRCMIDGDCGENMVCLSEFCECAKQKYKRIAGPRCITPQTVYFEPNNTVHPIRRTPGDICLRRNPCENRGVCEDQLDGSFQCLCAFGWKGRHCNKKINITTPHFKHQSYLELQLLEPIKYLDLTLATEQRNGLILYSQNKLMGSYFIISLRDQILNITVCSNHLISTIQLFPRIELQTYVRLQIHLLVNEIQARLNNENISSKLLPFNISWNDTVYFGGVPPSLLPVYQQWNPEDGFQGCIHELRLNGRRILFNDSEHKSQNIDECTTNPCRLVSCPKDNRCIPKGNKYQCTAHDPSMIDRCLINPCEINQHCVNVHPNNYLCLCSNCSTNDPYIAGFHPSSYIKHSPIQGIESSGRLRIEIWFLSESASGLLIFSEHINFKRSHIKLYLQRKTVVFDVGIGTRTVSLRSRSPIELNQWHQCIIEIHGQKLSLILNQESSVISYELFSSNILWPRSFTFIGHVPNPYQSVKSHSYEGLHGAIQKITINNHSSTDIRRNAIELFNISDYYGYPCRPNPCSFNRHCHSIELNNYTCLESSITTNDISLELDGTINAIYSYTPSNLHRNYFELSVKTKYSSGLIFYIGETSASFFASYLSLKLVDGFPQFAAKVETNASVVLLTSKIRIDDGRWHRLEIERFRRRIIMKLDEHHRYQTVTVGRQTEFYPNPSHIYIGGYHRLCSYDEQHCRSFRGCLTNVTMDHQELDLIKDELNQHRKLKECHALI